MIIINPIIPTITSTTLNNPCLTCGACCAFYRVSFYWSEANDTTEGAVPVDMTCRVSPLRRVMKGTTGPKPHCIALQGEIGHDVYCSIYANRPSTSREFTVSERNNLRDNLCDRARRAWALPPLATIIDTISNAKPVPATIILSKNKPQRMTR